MTAHILSDIGSYRQHIVQIRGYDEHHIIEASFKSMGKALKDALRYRDSELSTKDKVKVA